MDVPDSCSFTMAMCVGVGEACSIGVILVFGRLVPCACTSHTPGPVANTVFIPLRKSGIPALERNNETLHGILYTIN